MTINFKKLNSKAVAPQIMRNGDAGADLTAVTKELDRETNIMTYGTGIAVEIPEGHVGLLFPRSSVYKKSLVMANSVGVIDSGYRGEIMIKYRRDISTPYGEYKIGDRVGQLVVVPIPDINYVESELSVTDRNNQGFGSTGE